MIIFGMLFSAIFYVGCGHVSQENKPLTAKQEAALHRGNTSEVIDREFETRLHMQLEEARKLVTHKDGVITVKHKFGTTVMPQNPQRIVVIRMEDPVLALGSVPMVAANNGEGYYLHDELTTLGVMNISVNEDSKTINFEQVQVAKPDLIIMRDSFDQNMYNGLSKIAPTAAFDLRKEGTALLALSRALNRESDGLRRLKIFYETAKTYRMGIHERIGNRTVALLRVMSKEVRLYPYSTNDINRFMYEVLNLRAPKMVLQADGNQTNNAISLEQLPDLDADYLLVSAGYGPNGRGDTKVAKERYEKMQSDPLWRSIPAVKKGHVYEVDTMIWNAHGILAKERAMKEIFRYLNKS